MAGIKRRTNYRKSVTNAILDDLPEIEDGQLIARVLKSHGSNLLEVVDEKGDSGMCMIPTKFRKLVWVGRGNYVVAAVATGDTATAAGTRASVRYIIRHILSRDHIRHLRKRNLWPIAFGGEKDVEDEESSGGVGTKEPLKEEEDEEEEDDDDSKLSASRVLAKHEDEKVHGAPKKSEQGVEYVEVETDIPLEDDPMFSNPRSNRRRPQVEEEDDEDDSSDED